MKIRRKFIILTAIVACVAAALLLLFLPGSPLSVVGSADDEEEVVGMALDEEAANEAEDVEFADVDADDDEEGHEDDSAPTERTEAKVCAAALEQVGGEYYELLFYRQMSNSMDDEALEDFLSNAEETGFSVSLGELEVFAARDGSAVAFAELKEQTAGWDSQQTAVLITPKAPYGEDDYTTLAVLP